MKMGESKIIAILVLSIMLISAVSALTIDTNPQSITQSLQQGQSATVPIFYSITNDGNSDVPAIFNLGNFPVGFLSSDTASVSVPANQTVTGTINLKINISSSQTPNTYSGSIFLASQVIPVSLTVTTNSQTPSGTCKIYNLPIPLSKTLQSGGTASTSIDVYVSKYCSSALTISTNQPQQAKPIEFSAVSGLVEPAGKFTIQINYDTTGVSQGTYQDSIVISGIDDNENQYSLSIPLSLTVSGTISPITNGSFSSMPTCSLSSSTFNLNQTYKLICTNLNPNIQILPVVDTSFLVGVAPYVETTASQYAYDFQPVKLGQTTIKANFNYQNAPAGAPFSQDIQINAGNIIVPNSALIAKFYPNLWEAKDGKVIVRILDNATGNVLDDSAIYINGVLSNNSLQLDPNTEYELRATHAGYLPLIQTVSVAPKIINFTLNSQYSVGDSLNFQTIPSNATILLDGNIITLPYTLSTEGTFVITASLLGYTSTAKNITVFKSGRILDSTATDQAKSGANLFMTVDRNDSSLRIGFKKDMNSVETNLNQTIGSTISIKISDAGIYNMYADNALLKTYTVSSNPFYKTWWFWTIAIILVVIIILVIASKSGGTSAPSGKMAFNLGEGGQSYNG